MTDTDSPAPPTAHETASFTSREAPWLEPFRRRRRHIRIAAVFGAVMAAAVLGLGVLVMVHTGESLPGVVVEGVDVGGLDRSDVRGRLADLVTARRRDPVVFTHGDTEFAFEPGEAAYGIDLDQTVTAAMEAGRASGVWQTMTAHVRSLFGRQRTLALDDDVKTAVVRSWVNGVAGRVDRQPFPGRVAADPASLEVKVDPPRDGLRVRRDTMVAEATAAITREGVERLQLPTESLTTEVDGTTIEAVADQARRALRGPLTLRAHGVNVVLSPEEIARLITSKPTTRNGSKTVVLHVPVEPVEKVFEPYVSRLEVEPRSATFEPVSGFVTFDEQNDATWQPQPAELQVVPGQNGAAFDPTLTANQLRDVFAEGRRTAELELKTVEPDLTTDQAENLGVDHLIGTFTTYHDCCQPRVTNIHRMADIVRGTVLEPGEVFSINNIVGRRTRAKGFVADGTIVDGELVNEVGGGVSQFATTTFNAAFFADLPVLEYKPHSYYISRYPMGREATLYYPYLDTKFKNNTEHGVYVHTSYTDTSITMSIFGDNGGKNIRAELGQPYNYSTPDTQYRFNGDLCAGCTRTVQSSQPAFSVVVTRYVNGEPEEFTTRYTGRPRIVERGPAPRSSSSGSSGSAESSDEGASPPPNSESPNGD